MARELLAGSRRRDESVELLLGSGRCPRPSTEFGAQASAKAILDAACTPWPTH